MRTARLPICLVLGMFCLYLNAQLPAQEMTVTGTLNRVMAIGAESTGWAIQLDSAITVGGKQIESIQVTYRNTAKLEKLADKRVTAVGKLSHREGVETGTQPVLVLSAIRKAREKATGEAAPQSAPFSLSASQWLLEDMGGTPVLRDAQATLAFPETGQVAGNGSCNRFFGPAEVKGGSLKLGPLGATRMACPEAIMNQETRYLNMLQAAGHFEAKDARLRIYCQGFEKPLLFTRIPTPKPDGN
jgi:heat shock protein HslJ